MSFLINKYRWVVNVVIITVFTFFTAKIVTQVVASSFEDNKEVKLENHYFRQNHKNIKNKDVYNPIVDRNIFDSKNTSKSIEEKRARDITNKDLSRSRLDARLLGTIVMRPESLSMATINFRNEVGEYFIGDKLDDGEIVSIQRNRVVLNRNGALEYLETEEETMARSKVEDETESASTIERPTKDRGIYKKSGNEFEISREKLDSTLTDLNVILKQARAVPNIVNGKTQGFKIFAIRPNSIYRELGIQNGDVIERVNGNEINTPESALQLFQSLRTEANFSIDLVRRGQKQTFRYEVK